MPFDDIPLRDILVDRDGVSLPLDGGQPSLSLCESCHSSVKNGRTPALALANRTFLGPIIKIKEENQDLELQNTQRGIHGHIIIYPQQPSKIAEILPPSVDEITEPICILFVGSSRPTPEWLRDHAKPLAVNASRVRNALIWLKTHNPLYRDIQINEECLRHLEDNPVLPFNIEHV
ncbi:hypothetical protein B0H13DRAFT_1604883, partial [Mycena leptocephala]